MTASVVRLRYNEQNLTKHLQFAFSSHMSVMGELLQNARRSGATEIRLGYTVENDVAELVAHDNGGGISDMRLLFDKAESGWDEKLIEEERAFGFGWMSCLFVGSSVRVESCGQVVDFATKDAISLMELPVSRCPTRIDTYVTVRGVRIGDATMSIEEMGESLRKLVEGFPVPVWFNGVELPRPYAINSGLRFETGSIGQYHIKGIHDVKWVNFRADICADSLLFLQGLPVGEVSHAYSYHRVRSVVHLDSREFTARWPDRDCLHNHETQHQRVYDAIYAACQKHLRAAVKRLPVKVVAERGYPTLKFFNVLDCYNGIPLLPREFCGVFGEAPQVTWESDTFLGLPEAPIARKDIESGKVRIAKLDDYEADESEFSAWMAAYLTGAMVLGRDLPDGHWAAPHVREFGADDVKIKVVGLKEVRDYDGSWCDARVVFCRGYELVSPLGKVVSRKRGFVSSSENNVPAEKKGKASTLAYLPDGDDTTDIISQLSNFVSDDTYHEDDASNERRLFRRFVGEARGQGIETLLQDDLGELPRQSRQTYKGRRFEVAFDADGNAKVREIRKPRKSKK